MVINKDKIQEEFESLEQIQDFWETHSTADYFDEMEKAKFELSPALKSKIESGILYRVLDLSSKEIEKIDNEAQRKKLD